MQYLVRKSIQRLGRYEAGFSLIELLVAIGIMAAIAAITIPMVTRFARSGESGAQVAERETMQVTFDTWIAENAWPTITPRQSGASTQVFDGGAGNGPDFVLTGFLRDATTTYWYCWETNGDVAQKTSASDNCP